MKTTAIFIFLAMFISNTALAEKGEKREKLDIDALVVQLKLDKSKGEKFKKILEDQKKAMKEKHEQKRDNKKEKQKMTREQRQELRKQREAQHEAMDEKLLTVLSYEQLYKFKKYMKKFRQQHGKKQKPSRK